MLKCFICGKFDMDRNPYRIGLNLKSTVSFVINSTKHQHQAYFYDYPKSQRSRLKQLHVYPACP